MSLRPSVKKVQNCAGSVMLPASRQPMPTIAIGSGPSEVWLALPNKAHVMVASWHTRPSFWCLRWGYAGRPRVAPITLGRGLEAGDRKGLVGPGHPNIDAADLRCGDARRCGQTSGLIPRRAPRTHGDLGALAGRHDDV